MASPPAGITLRSRLGQLSTGQVCAAQAMALGAGKLEGQGPDGVRVCSCPRSPQGPSVSSLHYVWAQKQGGSPPQVWCWEQCSREYPAYQWT